ncbi:hypothetical protein A6E15_19295 [Natrinema saccharevitans]|uniref:Uncharacterized protein n=1 Tax=Natrinema saccharevitans TaxID=301967 RepID=A0A1S8ARG7_9EURY|nr:hypothetical protein [Natrinema saccharevitans]OLZ39111.1 hypothetical protein A6E15_19295 [Natrinema saccharevitans]
MSDPETQTVHGCLKTTGDQPDYAVLYGDELARAGDGDGGEDAAFSEYEIRNDENTRILVSYSESGLRSVSAYPADEPDEETTYEPADDQPESGTRWVPEDGDRPEIRILPETEVPA